MNTAVQKDGEGNQNESVICACVSVSKRLHRPERIYGEKEKERASWRERERESTTVVFSLCVARWALNLPRLCRTHIRRCKQNYNVLKKNICHTPKLHDMHLPN